MKIRHLTLTVVVVSALSGCTSVKGLFGGNDNTVLEGNRENVLPPDQQTARDPIVTGDQQPDLPAEPTTGDAITDQDAIASDTVSPPPRSSKCKLNDPNCEPVIDQEAGSTNIQ